MRCRSAAGFAARAAADTEMPASACSTMSSIVSSIISSNASASSRSCAAVRASAAATPGPEFGLEHGQHPLAHAHAGEPGIGVVRVVPRIEALGRAGGAGRRAAHLQQRAQQGDTRGEFGNGRHALQARGARPAGETQQHGLGLIVERVPDQHRAGSEIGCRSRQRRVARCARGGLRSAVLAHIDADHARLEAESPSRAPPRRPRHPPIPACSPWSTVTLATPEAEPGCLERGGGGERERVRAAGQRHDDRPAGRDPGQRTPDGEPHLGDGGIERLGGVSTAPRYPHAPRRARAELRLAVHAPAATRRAFGLPAAAFSLSSARRSAASRLVRGIPPPSLKEHTHGTRRRHRDPPRQPREVRSRPRHRPRVPRPRAVHADGLPRRLRILREHARRGRRPARRAGAARCHPVPRRHGQRAPGRRAEDEGRGRRRRQARGGPDEGPALEPHPGPRRHPRVHEEGDRALLRALQGPRAQQVGQGRPVGRQGRGRPLLAESIVRFAEHEGQTKTQGEGEAPKTV